MATLTEAPSQWKLRRRRNFRATFGKHEFTQPTPQSTPATGFTPQGQPFGGLAPAKAAVQGPLLSSPSKHNLRSTRRQTQDGLLPATTSIHGPFEGSSRNVVEGLSGIPLHASSPHDVAAEQARYDHAWHVVTSKIALPSSVAAEDSFGTLAPESQVLSQDVATDSEFRVARQIVLDPKEHAPLALHTQDVLAWHLTQCRRHFGQHVLPMLHACVAPAGATSRTAGAATSGVSSGEALKVLENSVRTIEDAHRLYVYGFRVLHQGSRLNPAKMAAVTSQWLDEIHTLVEAAAPSDLVYTLRTVMRRLVSIILGVHLQEQHDASSDDGGFNPGDASTCRQILDALVSSLKICGLAGEKFEILFADIMDEMLSLYIHQTCARRWDPLEVATPKRHHKHSLRTHSASSCVIALGIWVEDSFALLAAKVLATIRTGKHGEVSFQRLQSWKKLALSRVASLRISELFDIVQAWPASKGGLDDLRVSVTDSKRRTLLVTRFSAALERNLLTPGRSTLEILRAYIAVIKTFHYLDHTNVLLNRSVGPLQLYLCRRDDAVRLVVGGLLSNPDEAQKPTAGSAKGTESTETGDRLIELAEILNDPATQRSRHIEDGDQDWNDMNWKPDPIDAGVNYRRPKSEDVIGTLINALGSKDVFIKEFQNIVAERLLSSQDDFKQEHKVLKLLKKRFGDSALQNCDVMIRDIMESRRIDTAIHQKPPPPQRLGSPELSTPQIDERLHARILSRLYWPDLEKEGFLLPTPIANAQKHYEASFEHLKAGRKLAWMDHLGQATVELELVDRTVAVDCSTVEASVIYAFQTQHLVDADESDNPVTRSVEELEETLRMDADDLIRPALAFWVAQGVLRTTDNSHFTVIEDRSASTSTITPKTTDQPSGPSGPSPIKPAVEAPAPPQPAAAKPVSAKEKMQRTLYWQFIVGMLTNSAASMPPMQITMMLKVMIPDYSWNEEQLTDLLGEKVGEGVVEVVGGKYKLIKK